jgi:hypothetical protein
VSSEAGEIVVYRGGVRARRLAMMLILSSIVVVCTTCGMDGAIVSSDDKWSVAEKCEREGRGSLFGMRGIDRIVDITDERSEGRSEGMDVNGSVTSGTRRGRLGDDFESIEMEEMAWARSG